MSFKLNEKYIRIGNQLVTYNEPKPDILLKIWINPDGYYNGSFINGYNGNGSLSAYTQDTWEQSTPIIQSNQIAPSGYISEKYKIEINIINIKIAGSGGLNFYIAEATHPLKNISNYSSQYNTSGIKTFDLTLKNNTSEPLILVCFMGVGGSGPVGFNFNSASIIKI